MADRYFILADFRSYANAQQKINDYYKNKSAWRKSALLNIAHVGKFSSYRTIQEYVDDIWHLDRITVNMVYKHGKNGYKLKRASTDTRLCDNFFQNPILLPYCGKGYSSDDKNGIGGQTLIDVYWVMRSIGRMAFPVFCFLLVEGFKYTHSREKYAARMFIFALISEIPFDLAINNTVLEFKSNNVFFTLLLGLLAITVLDWLKSVDKIEKASSAVKWFLVTLIRCIVMVSVVLVMMIIAEFVLCCDYGAAGVGCIVMMYLLSSNRDVAFAVAVILLGLFSGTIEFFALFMLIPLRYYNGKRGISLKYVFYAFYPVHLFVLYLICRLAMAAAVHT